MKQPWNQLPGESSKAFAQFSRYRNMKPSERSVDGAWHELQQSEGNQKVTRRPNYFYNWSVKFHWKERAEAWDAEQQKAGDDAVLDEITARKKKYAKQLDAVLGKCFLRLGLIRGKQSRAGEPMTEGEAGRIAPKVIESIMLLLGEATSRQENLGGNINVTAILAGITDGEKARLDDLLGKISARERQVGQGRAIPILSGSGETDNGGNGKKRDRES